jgi:MerR family copper efflux transcriptional regulator
VTASGGLTFNLDSTFIVDFMTFTIGEIAERSGFSASALRYYERIGLVAPATRSDGGYRLYDGRTLDRLTFIERAKQLGCSLDDIADLIEIWERDECGPAQRRLHHLVTANLDNAKRQIAEITDFVGQLEAAATHLSGTPVDGPCGPGCACVAADEPAVAGAESVTISHKLESAPIACTLDAGAMPQRLDEWRAVLDRATARRSTGVGGLRVEFGDEVDLPQLSRLMAEEQQCCAFFSFSLTVDHRGVALEVRAPEEAGDVVAALFGRAS